MLSDDWMMRSRDWLTWSSDWMCALRDQHMRSLCRTFARRFCVALSLQRIRLATLAGDAMTIAQVLCRGGSPRGCSFCQTIDYRLSIFPRIENKGRGCISGEKIILFDEMFLSDHNNLCSIFRFWITKQNQFYPHPTFTGKLQNGSHPTHATIYFFLVFFCFGVSPHIAV